MRFAVDAHAIGRHLTGNEVYVRSLLNSFSSLDNESEFVTYISVEEARAWIEQLGLGPRALVWLLWRIFCPLSGLFLARILADRLCDRRQLAGCL